MRRRTLIKGLAGLPVLFNQLPFAAGRSLLSTLANNPSDRILVLIQLNGGNDGLNTLVPLDQYDHLVQARSNVMLPKNQLLNLGGDRAFHPSFAGMRALYDEGRVSIVQDVGYPNHNRSHFRSTDIYHTGSASDEVLQTGWLGRLLDQTHPGYPAGYPNATYNDPIAVTLGTSVSVTCQGATGNFALTVDNPYALTHILGGDTATDPSATRFLEEQAFISGQMSQANAYGSTVKAAAEAGSSTVQYPDTPFATQLSYIARMVSGGLQTQVYVVTLGGFDTHAAQVVPGDPGLGEHATLLQTLSEGIEAFQRDIRALGYGERILGLTYSEFGRRIRSNAAHGTDHGTAAPTFLFGDCVQGGVLGNNPVIPDQVDVNEGVPVQYDFRDVHGTVLEDWLGVPAAEVRTLLHPDYRRLPLLSPCGASSTSAHQATVAAPMLSLGPNPCGEFTQLALTIPQSGWVQLSVQDVRGAQVEVLLNRRLSAKPHALRLDTSRYAPGVYFIRAQVNDAVHVKRLVRR